MKKKTRARTNKNAAGLRALLASDDRDRYGSRTPANEPAAARPTSQPRQARGERPIRNRREGKKEKKKNKKLRIGARSGSANRPTNTRIFRRARSRARHFISVVQFIRRRN